MKIVVDIDSTLIYTEFLNNDYIKISNNDDLIDRINALSAEGHEIIVYTGRGWDKIETTRRQLSEIGLSYDMLIMGKPVADYYIDDKGITAEDFLELIF